MTQTTLPIDCAAAASQLRTEVLNLGVTEKSFGINVRLPDEWIKGALEITTASQLVFDRLRKGLPHDVGGWPVQLITNTGPIVAPWPDDPQVETKYHGRVFQNATGEEVPFDELVIFRSRDNAFPQALEAYILACQRIAAPLPHIVAARGLLRRVQAWREKNKELCRIPGSQRRYSMTDKLDAECWENILGTTKTTQAITLVTLYDAEKRVAGSLATTQQVTKQQTPQGETFAGGPIGMQIECEALGLDLKLTEPRPRHVPLINNAREMLIWHLPHEKAAIEQTLNKILESVCADATAGSCAKG